MNTNLPHLSLQHAPVTGQRGRGTPAPCSSGLLACSRPPLPAPCEALSPALEASGRSSDS